MYIVIQKGESVAVAGGVLVENRSAGIADKGDVKCTKERCVMHYPTLETVMMVEETIKKIGPAKLSQIHRSTEKQVMWGTLKLIIDYLESRNMIATDREGKVVWIFDPKGVAKYKKRKDLWI